MDWYLQEKTAATPAEAAKDADFIFTCVGNDNDLREATTGSDGAFQNVKKGAVFIDNTTVTQVARELFNTATEKGFGFLDAPVSGGQAGAENGALTVMVGGQQSDFEKAEPIIDCYSKKIKLLGSAAGSGQLAKMVNQICIAGLVQGLSEGLRFGQNAGLNVEDVVEVISKGAALICKCGKQI